MILVDDISSVTVGNEIRITVPVSVSANAYGIDVYFEIYATGSDTVIATSVSQPFDFVADVVEFIQFDHTMIYSSVSNNRDIRIVFEKDGIVEGSFTWKSEYSVTGDGVEDGNGEDGGSGIGIDLNEMINMMMMVMMMGMIMPTIGGMADTSSSPSKPPPGPPYYPPPSSPPPGAYTGQYEEIEYRPRKQLGPGY